MQDRHEVVLEANITNFKNKMKEAQKISSDTGKKIAENNKFGVWKDDIYTLSNGMQFVKKSTSELNNEIEDTGKVTKQVGTEISQAFNKGLKSVKKLTLGFLGARSAFGLFKKYMSEYRSQNEAFNQKMQLTTNIITNALAPAFEFFANVIQYVVIGLARVVELLFGVNILGKTIDNSLKGASKSAKELNENLSGLDEISNIDQSSADGLSSGLTGQLEALEEFKKKIAEVDAWFKKHKIDEKIKAIGDAIKGVWDWAQEHPILATSFVAGLIALKTGILPGLINLIAGSGGLSLVGAFKGLIALGVTTWTFSLISDMDKIDESVSENTKKLEEQADFWETLAEKRRKSMKKKNEYSEGETKKANQEYNNAIETLEKEKEEWKQLTTLKAKYLEPSRYIEAKRKIKEIDKHIQEIKDSQNEVNARYEIANNKIGTTIFMSNELKNVTEKAAKKAEVISTITGEWEENIDGASSKFKNFKGTLSTGFNVPMTLDLDTMDTKVKMNNLLEEFNKKFSNLLSKTMPGFLKLPSYDVGTDYVPHDQVALIHEGERIIPKQYNNSQYLGQLGNYETNSLLMELNRNVLELANKPSILNVNGKELAKATYSDYQEESNRRGNNLNVRRV